jgi:hypothetical protein
LVAGRELRISKVSEKSLGLHQPGSQQAKPPRDSGRPVKLGLRAPDQSTERKMLGRRITPARNKRD